MTTANRTFPFYGFAGIIVIVVSEILLFLDVNMVGVYFTPLVWTGYILLVDALNVRLHTASLMTKRPREFLAMLPWSVCCWLIFEGYNLHLHNWRYLGLPDNIVLRLIGYVWSFATIFPAILETAELFEGTLPHRPRSPVSISEKLCVLLVMVGMVCLVTPLLVPSTTSAYLFGLVWVGFYFLLDPINYHLKGRSILSEIQTGTYSKVYAISLSGIVCGLLWEFWNYWAIAKWQYAISFGGPKIFEMPLLGYLGFIPFAFECYAMQELLVTMIPALRRRNTAT